MKFELSEETVQKGQGRNLRRGSSTSPGISTDITFHETASKATTSTADYYNDTIKTITSLLQTLGVTTTRKTTSTSITASNKGSKYYQ